MDLQEKPTVLVVDDSADVLTLLGTLLKDMYRVRLAMDGDKALHIAQSAHRPDLILLDVMMPGKDGYEVCQLLKRDPVTADIPIIFITAQTQAQDETRGFEVGGADYIAKPICPATLLARVRTHLQNKAAADFLKDQNVYLEREVVRRARELAMAQDATILAMGTLAETRDPETGLHIRRTQHFVNALAEHLRHHPRFAHALDPHHLDMLFKSAPLHDIGKVGIPDRVLLKPGRLDEDEMAIMRTHSALGADAIARAEALLGTPLAFLATAREIALGHHEKWDGSGYPQGLSGEDIPVSARLMAVADVYDALTTRRVYKPAMSHEQARQMLLAGSGTHFDPDVIAAFEALHPLFMTIAAQFADTDQVLLNQAQHRVQATVG